MAGITIRSTDFTGRYTIAQNSFTDIDKFIDLYEEQYLQDLLGVTLYNLFKADVSTYVPQTPIYLAIFNKFAEDKDRQINRSAGMKNMLLGFIYWHFQRQDMVKQTTTGPVQGSPEVSTAIPIEYTQLYSIYNESIDIYRAIQCYIKERESDYPDYNGQCKQFNHWVL